MKLALVLTFLATVIVFTVDGKPLDDSIVTSWEQSFRRKREEQPGSLCSEDCECDAGRGCSGHRYCHFISGNLAYESQNEKDARCRPTKEKSSVSSHENDIDLDLTDSEEDLLNEDSYEYYNSEDETNETSTAEESSEESYEYDDSETKETTEDTTEKSIEETEMYGNSTEEDKSVAEESLETDLAIINLGSESKQEMNESLKKLSYTVSSDEDGTVNVNIQKDGKMENGNSKVIEVTTNTKITLT